MFFHIIYGNKIFRLTLKLPDEFMELFVSRCFKLRLVICSIRVWSMLTSGREGGCFILRIDNFWLQWCVN